MKTTDLIKEFNSITKIKIACYLLEQRNGLTVSTLTNLINCKRENVSKQICELFQSGVVIRDKDGRNNLYYLNFTLPSAQLSLIKALVYSYQSEELEKSQESW